MSESTALVKRIVDEAPIEVYTEERIALIARTIAAGATVDELALFVTHCKSTGLSPLQKQVYFVKDQKGRISFMTGIDGLRLIAQRTGEYEGQIGPLFKADPKSEWSDTPPEGTPYASKVGAWRKGFREPSWGIATYKSFVRDTPTWKSMPDRMLAIRAESFALKKAFPAETAGLSVSYDESGEESTSVVVVDPDNKATNPQIAKLHMLAKDLGWDDEERHTMAGVDSFSQLNKGQASDLIELWQEALEDVRADENRVRAGDTQANGQASGSSEPGQARRASGNAARAASPDKNEAPDPGPTQSDGEPSGQTEPAAEGPESTEPGEQSPSEGDQTALAEEPPRDADTGAPSDESPVEAPDDARPGASPEPAEDDLEDPLFQVGPEGVKGQTYSTVCRTHPEHAALVIEKRMLPSGRLALLEEHLERARMAVRANG